MLLKMELVNIDLIPWGTNGTSYEQVYRTNGQSGRMPGSAMLME